MTRASLNRTLRRVYIALGFVLVLALVLRFAHRLPGIGGTAAEAAAGDLYGYLKDMALIIVALAAASLANAFQKRSRFVARLEEQWRAIARTKSALVTYCEKPYVATDDYLAALGRISETIDNVRCVYANVGETRMLAGLDPYAPLHDMRRALQSLDPRLRKDIPPEARRLARDAILQSFEALREAVLEELDLEEPTRPLLVAGGHLSKRPGASRAALSRAERQRKRQDRAGSPRPDVDALLIRLIAEEERPPDGGRAPPPA